jgi:hypothetical protein
MEFSLMLRDMVRKPQGKPVMDCRDMKVDFSPGCEGPLREKQIKC